MEACETEWKSVAPLKSFLGRRECNRLIGSAQGTSQVPQNGSLTGPDESVDRNAAPKKEK